jgi:hypothetical protein
MSLISFLGKTFVVASMHQKAEAMASVLEKELGMRFLGEVNVNTDLLGTFSGEVPRTLEPLDAAREKCRMALSEKDSSVAIATEGSFFPHPSIPFALLHTEHILFYFPQENFEFHVVHHTTQTNFNGKLLHSISEAVDFAKDCLFPSHGIIVKAGAEDVRFVKKDCSTWEELNQAIEKCLELHGQVYLETDMRAMRNPTRMEQIREATKKLATLLAQHCPVCEKPGFGKEKSLPGLECELCHAPTQLEKRRIKVCSFCMHSEPAATSTAEMKASAMYCNFCNP